jgi:hypothetical protein
MEEMEVPTDGFNIPRRFDDYDRREWKFVRAREDLNIRCQRAHEYDPKWGSLVEGLPYDPERDGYRSGDDE